MMMSGHPANNPKYALKRAQEFLEVGRKNRALDVLTEAIKNRKHRIWQKSHEDIMLLFTQLCVDLKQSQTAKEGLHQYKNLTANINPKSLEDVIRHYLRLSEEKCEEARGKATTLAAGPTADVDDLDQAESPEGMLLKAVSTDTTQDRADRVTLLPWVRFNWEAYRHCLDLLRNLSKLEALYHDIAAHAFKFCMKFTRKTELRKLCEMLRNHIGQISKREVMTPNAVNLNNPETQELNLRTRLVQLDHAIAMEMWQEAFRAIEDVHGLMTMLKRVPKAALKANYFEKLALVFLRAGNAVFHAAAQHKLFTLYRNFRKDLTPEELRKLAVTVLFATLAVPLQPPRTHLESLLEYDESAASKLKQLTMLVGYNLPPTRAKMVEDLSRLGIIQLLRPDMQQLYQNLEMSFDPLHMGSQIASILATVKNDDELSFVRQYVKVIEEVAVGKQLRQMAQAFDSIQINRVTQLMPYTDWHTIERVAIETARNTDLEVRIDHRAPGLFVFGSDVALAPYEAQPGEGPSDSQIPTDRVRSQLVTLLTALTKTQRATKSKETNEEESDKRAQLFALYRKNASREHASTLARGKKTEERKAYLEKRVLEKVQQADEKRRHEDMESELAETVRAQRDTKQFEEQRNMLKKKEFEKSAIREKLENMKKTEFGMRVLKELSEADADTLELETLNQLEQKHREELKREEEENLARLKVQEKKIDHAVRAKHKEEVPLRKQYNSELAERFKQTWAEDERQRVDLARQRHEFMTNKREKMARMKEQHNAFLSMLQERNQKIFDEKMAQWQNRMQSEKVKRLAEARHHRRVERERKWNEEMREIEEAKAREEEARRLQDEQDAKATAKAESERKFREMEEKQRAREAEIEAKRMNEDKDRFSARRPPVPAGSTTAKMSPELERRRLVLDPPSRPIAAQVASTGPQPYVPRHLAAGTQDPPQQQQPQQQQQPPPLFTNPEPYKASNQAPPPRQQYGGRDEGRGDNFGMRRNDDNGPPRDNYNPRRNEGDFARSGNNVNMQRNMGPAPGDRGGQEEGPWRRGGQNDGQGAPNPQRNLGDNRRNEPTSGSWRN